MANFIEVGITEIDGKRCKLYKQVGKHEYEDDDEDEEYEYDRHGRRGYYRRRPLRDRAGSWWDRNKDWVGRAVVGAAIGWGVHAALDSGKSFVSGYREGRHLDSGEIIEGDIVVK